MQMTDVKGYPLSMQQTRIWEFLGDSPSSPAQCSIWLDGVVNIRTLLETFQCLIKQHDILRTVFHRLPGMEIPIQIVMNQIEIAYTFIDMEELSVSGQTEQLEDYVTCSKHPVTPVEDYFSLSFHLVRLSSKKHLLLLQLPTLCADGYTLTALASELSRIYTSFQEGVQSYDDSLQYADVVALQKQLFISEESEAPRRDWRKIDLSQLTMMHLPFAHKEPPKASLRQKGAFAPQSLPLPLDEKLSTQMSHVALHYGVSLEAWLLACWEVSLWHLGGKQNLVLGVAQNGRNHEDLTNTLGPHTRFVPVKTYLEDDLPFDQILRSVNVTLLGAGRQQTYFMWEDASLPDAVDGDFLPPFFPICFEYEDWPASFGTEHLTFSLFQKSYCAEPFALKFTASQREKQLHIALQYDPQRMSITQVYRLEMAFSTFLESVVAQPQASVSLLSLLKPDEQTALIQMGHAPGRQRSSQRLHQLFEEQAWHHPNQEAVISAREHLTYQQLNEQANRLAQVLRQRRVGPNVLVGICMERQAQMLVGVLAILKAGGAYLPLDPATPQARQTYQLQESGAMLLLTQQQIGLHLPEWEGETLCLEDLEQELAQASAENLPGGSQEEDLAYVIYTSGSMGTPKGVMIGQRSIVNYALALCERLGGEPGWQYATVSTLAADLGNTAIFCALVSGGCVQVLDYETVTSAEAMVRWTREHPIDVLKIVPSHISTLLAGKQAHPWLPRRALVLGGEAFFPGLLAHLREGGALCQIYNHYGPTEATIGVLVHNIGTLDEQAGEMEEPIPASVPLGSPITNSDVYVVDSRMRLVPMGVIGELYVGGAGLARGYLKQPEQTAERFVPHPWSVQGGARLYRTGDLVRYDDEGLLTFVGRVDTQVKLRGYRIEIGEIETVLRRHPQVWDCTVLLQEQGPAGPRLIGYVVARTVSGVTAEGLGEMLRQSLPEYMVPSSFVLLEALPLTSNGKVDRRHLPQPEQVQSRTAIMPPAPRSPLEEALLKLWTELLGQSELGIYDNFFAVGGHSLLATRLIAQIRALFQVELPVKAVFEAPTVAELARSVEQCLRQGEGVQMLPLVIQKRPEALPLSYAQQRLWFLEQLEPGSTTYLIPRALSVQGGVETESLEQALQEVMNRHESLRTTFSEQDGQPMQVIHAGVRSSLPVIDLQGVSSEQRAGEAHRLAHQEGQHPCDLVAGPLLRTALLRLAAQEQVLLLTLHHIITDGWSNTVLVRELTTLYRSFEAGQPSPLLPMPLQYADYALWQRRWFQGEVLEAQLAYWRTQLAEVPPLELPTDHPRPVVQTYRGASQFCQLPVALSEGLQALSQQEHVTMFMVVLAALQVLLHRYSGQQDFSVGTPIANRRQAETEGLIGFFVNTLVMRSDLCGDPSFVQVLQRVREVCLGAYAHQDVPFEQVVEALAPTRDLSRSPLFQVMLVLQNAPQEQADLAGVQVRSFGVESTISKFDLTLSLSETGQGLHCTLEYNTVLFEAETIARLLGHWQTLLQGIVQEPQMPLWQLPLLTAEEREQLLVSWNATVTPYPQDLGLHQLFEQQVQRIPEAVALVSEEQALTYRELNERANQLAHCLQTLAVGPDVLVGLCVERSLHLLLGILGILKAGGAYVPLDPDSPAERQAFLLENAQISVLVTQQSMLASLPSWQGHLLCLDRDWSLVQRQSKTDLRVPLHPEHLAYVIYTSGSTGQPKGVQVSHANVTRLFHATAPTMALSTHDIWTMFHSYAFDFSVWEIWGALLYGGRLIVVPYWIARSPDLFYTLLAEQCVTVLNQTPSAFQQVMQVEEVHQAEKDLALRLIIFGGEALNPKRVSSWVRRHGLHHPQLVNMYGITETTVHVTAHLLTEADLKEGEVSVIGRRLPDLQCYVFDRHQQVLPIGIAGELYVGGMGVARGYGQRSDLSAERFVPHPWSQVPGARLYRTGDLVRYRSDGTMEYLGRIDQQVKLRGYRIELGEIASVLREQQGVRDAVVQVREDVGGQPWLVAYVVGSEEATAGDVRGSLQEQLPAYMIPSRFVWLDALPLTYNGKVDKRALPTPDGIRPDLQETFVAPRTSVERMLATIWSQVLRVDQVGIHDNFFTLGGDSILSLQVIARARQAGLHLTVKQLFHAQSIAALSSVITAAEPLHFEQALITGPVHLTPIQRWFFARQLPELSHFNQAIVLQAPQPLRLLWLEQVLRQLVLHHDALRLRFFSQAEGWRQEIAGSPESPVVRTVDLSAIAHNEQSAVMTCLAEAAQASLDLGGGLLLQALCVRVGAASPDLLLLIIHHLAVDGVSWRILVDDLESAYGQRSRNELIRLPEKTTSWQHWAERLWEYAQSESVRSELRFWTASRNLPMTSLPVDMAGGPNTIASSATVQVSLSVEHTQALLHEVPAAYHTQINEVLLTALVMTFATWTEQPRLLIDLEGHGREDVIEGMDLSRTVGWFTTIFPVLLDIEQATTPGDALERVKEQLRQIPHKGLGYGLLRYLSQDARLSDRLTTLPEAQIAFNYLGQFDASLPEASLFSLADAPTGSTHSSLEPRRHLLEINGNVMGGHLHLSWQYSRAIHHHETIQGLAQRFLEALTELIVYCQSPEAGGSTPSDFPLAHLDQSQLDELTQQLSQAQVGRAGKQVEDLYPLSPMQAGLLFHSLYAPETGIYCFQSGWTIQGKLDETAWQEAWQCIIDRHSILRTCFVWQGLPQPLQVVFRHVETPWTFHDWRSLPEHEQQRLLETLPLEHELKRADLGQAPLLRLALARLGEHVFSFHLSIHHLIIDGWSQQLLLQEVQEAYAAFSHGHVPIFSPTRPYRDYIAWVQQQETQQAEHFWRTYLSGLITSTPLPGSVGTSTPSGVYPAIQQQVCSEAFSASLRERTQQLQLTLNTVLQGAWGLLLSRYSGEADVVFGATTMGRPADLAGMETMVGVFINTLPVRMRISPELSLSDWLRQVQTEQVEARQYGATPLVQIQAWSALPPGHSLFESLMVFQNYPRGASVVGNATDMQSRRALTIEQTHYPLMIKGIPTATTLILVLQYDEARFEASLITRLLQQLQVLLHAIVEQPDQRLGTLSLLTQEERQRLLIEWNRTLVPFPASATIQQLFEQQVEYTPETVALVFENEHLTYGELDRRANQLAHRLQRLGVGPEVMVGVCLEKSVEMALAVLGVLKAGGVIVPLDPSYPKERLAFVMADACLSLLLTIHSLRALLPESQAQTILLDQEWKEIALEPTTQPDGKGSVDQLLYVIYTSGSTGTPKGVSLPHRALINLLNWHEATLYRHARTLQFAPLSFDASFHELFAAWSSGGTLYVVAESMRRDVVRLITFLAERAIEKAILPVVMLNQIAQKSARQTHGLRSLREVIATGEQLQVTTSLTALFEKLENAPTLHNHYGPSETHVVTAYTVPGPVSNWPTHPPIGRPIANTQIYLLDSQLQPVPIGVVGELFVGGMNLARGYLGRADLTAERFLPHPLSQHGGERLYKTGDLARYQTDGVLEYLGRQDHQVKIRGYRVELEEIESLLHQHADVREAVVLVYEEAGGDKEIVAYVIPKQEHSLTTNQLRVYLQSKVPDYMVPSSFMLLETLPLTPNGKVDRRTLPHPVSVRPELDVAFVSPRTPAEEVVAGIWTEILGVEHIGIYDNFFQLGGHSLRAVQVISRVRDAFQVEVPLQSLFERPTVDGLVRELAQLRGGQEIVEEIALVLKEIELLSDSELEDVSYN
jgi:amino acid adenylation domain-containing protein/non-ribosomal peptide synthase protein (TIGR01720 family)